MNSAYEGKIEIFPSPNGLYLSFLEFPVREKIEILSSPLGLYLEERLEISPNLNSLCSKKEVFSFNLIPHI